MSYLPIRFITTRRVFARRLMAALAVALPITGTAAASIALSGSDDAPPVDPPLTARDMIGKTLRVFEPGVLGTMEVDNDRVNIEVDENLRIVRIYMG